MLFQSTIFLVFFFCTFVLFCITYKNKKTAILVLAGASLIFYSYGGIMALLVLGAVAVVDYLLGHLIHRTENESKRKLLVAVSVTFNLVILSFFKYFGAIRGISGFQLILPIGISFYTFESMSYIIDIYRRKYVPRNNFFEYILFISYFPHLVAGPIIRPANFFRSLDAKFNVTGENLRLGLFRFLCGLVKKIYIADVLGFAIVDPVFSAYGDFHAAYLWWAAIASLFQVYFDFSGYSDMAIGISQVFGIIIPENFQNPFSARNAKEFWKRWHISLSLWFRDYLYFPLGGSQKGELRKYFNIFFTMSIVGLWHGASLNQLFWGALHGILLCSAHLWEKLSDKYGFKSTFAVITTERFVNFMLIAQITIFNRLSGIDEGMNYLKKMYSENIASLNWSEFSWGVVFLCFACLLIEVISNIGFKKMMYSAVNKGGSALTIVIIFVLFFIIINAESRVTPFIYFQF